MKTIKVRNKNALLELLKDKAHFERITLADDLRKDNQIRDILSIAHSQNIPVEKMLRRKMAKGRSGNTREGLVAYMVPKNIFPLKEILNNLEKKNEDPFFLLINRVGYTSNVGVIARTAFAAGINGLIFQGEQDRFLNDETLHFSMGAIARIPLVKMSIFESLKELKKYGVRTVSLQMGGNSYFKEDFTGPTAFVLGAEGEGVSEKVSSRCDKKISIPMNREIDSLNVGVSAAIIIYEKIRQDGMIK